MAEGIALVSGPALVPGRDLCDCLREGQVAAARRGAGAAEAPSPGAPEALAAAGADGFESDSVFAALEPQAASEAARKMAAMGARRRAVTAMLRSQGLIQPHDFRDEA